MHIRLSEHSSWLTTFWGPACRYRWLRLPFGISSAPEEFQRRVVVVADDILIYGKGTSMAEAHRSYNEALLQLLKRARECNIKLNRNKMRLRMTELLHIGHRISEKGIRPDPAKVTAVKRNGCSQFCHRCPKVSGHVQLSVTLHPKVVTN